MVSSKKIWISVLSLLLVVIFVTPTAAKKKKGLEPIPYDNPREQQEWFYNQRAYPGEIGDIPWQARWEAIDALKAKGYFRNDGLDTWVCDGPYNLSGRTIAFWIDEYDPECKGPPPPI